jgi:uncharacterized membrane protein
LFAVSYLWHADAYLVDRSLNDWTPGIAAAAALSFLVVFWFLYDGACRVAAGRRHGEAVLAALVLALVCLASWLACHWFAGRAAFVLVGAMLGTAMSANVFFRIIPGQRKVVAALQAGQPVDPVHGERGKQRSVHNTYFTLPVLFSMLSNHYSFTWSHPRNWLVLVLMMLAGAAIRQFFVMRHGFKLGRSRNPLPYALAGTALIALTIAWLRPDAPRAAAAAAPAAGYQEVQAVLAQRCYSCHGAQLQMKNLRLDSHTALKQHAQAVYQQAVATRLMPLNNATGMTEGERALVGRWFRTGAPAP